MISKSESSLDKWHNHNDYGGSVCVHWITLCKLWLIIIRFNIIRYYYVVCVHELRRLNNITVVKIQSKAAAEYEDE